MRTLALLLLAVAASTPAFAQTPATQWPTKPVRVIVPFPAGGTNDVIARTLAPKLSDEFGQQFVVDNRSGAGGAIGAEIAARATPDGYTVIIGTSSYAPNGVLHKPSYDPVKGIAPIGMITLLPFLLVVNPSVKAANLKEFVDLIRAQPGALNFASPGTGSTPHLAAEWLQQLTKGKLNHVAYKGDGPALVDLLAGQVHAMIATEVVMGPHIRSGKVRALAATTAKRSTSLPDLPAIGEQVPGYVVDGWAGMWAPSGTPATVVMRLKIGRAHV